MGRQSYNLQSDPPDISSTYLVPYLAVKTSLTIFPMPLDYFVTTNLYFFVPSPFDPAPNLPPLWLPSGFFFFPVPVDVFLFCLFIYFVL